MLPVRVYTAGPRHTAHAGHDQEDRTVTQLQNEDVHARVYSGKSSPWNSAVKLLNSRLVLSNVLLI